MSPRLRSYRPRFRRDRATWTAIISLSVLATAASIASAASVYSVGGLGEPLLEEGARIRSMGGAGAAEFGAERFSLVNPASVAGVKHLVLQGTVLPTYRRLSGALGTETARETTLPSLRALVRLPGSLVIGGAYAVGTDASFRVDRSEDAGTPSALRIDGTGGLQSVRLTAARVLSPRLRIGAEYDIIAGHYREEWTRDFEDPALATSRDTLEARYERQGRWRVGAQTTLGRWTVGGVVETGRRLPLTFVQRATGSTIESSGGNLRIPSGFTVGVAGPVRDRWSVAAQYRRANWERSSLESELVDFRALQRFSLGLERGPGDEIGKGWRSRLPLRIGASYLQWPDLLPRVGQPTIAGGTAGVNEWVVSLGTGFVTQDKGGGIDLSLEAGSRGSKDELGVNERFLRAAVTLQVSDDTWR
jgi:hypothetical protein